MSAANRGEEQAKRKTSSLLEEMQQVQLAIDLIELGARLQVLQTETGLSRARLTKLYKEIRGNSPPRGMLPCSEEWFITWRPNIHSSLFYNLYTQLTDKHGCERIEAFVKAYRLYLEQMQLGDEEPILSITRAWTLVRFFESEMFELANCVHCRGEFVVHAYTPVHDYECGLCRPPSRAGIPAKRDSAEDYPSALSGSL